MIHKTYLFLQCLRWYWDVWNHPCGYGLLLNSWPLDTCSVHVQKHSWNTWHTDSTEPMHVLRWQVYWTTWLCSRVKHNHYHPSYRGTAWNCLALPCLLLTWDWCSHRSTNETSVADKEHWRRMSASRTSRVRRVMKRKKIPSQSIRTYPTNDREVFEASTDMDLVNKNANKIKNSNVGFENKRG